MSKKIKSITLKESETIIGFVESYKAVDSTQIANERTPGKIIDMPRHADFNRAMNALKPFLMLGTEFLRPVDDNGNHLQESHFLDLFADDDEQYKGLEVTGLLIQGKNANDGVQIFGTKETEGGDIVKIKTPSMPLKAVEGVEPFEFIRVLDTFVDNALHEAQLYHDRKKHGAGVQTEMPLNQPQPNAVNKKAKNLELVD